MINEFKSLLWLHKDMNIDIPDEKDIPYEVLFWDSEWNDNKIDLELVDKYLTIFDQSKDIKTRMACWCYGIHHISNLLNLYEYNKQWEDYNQIDPIDPWLEYLKENPQAQYEWSSLQTWLKKLLSNWLISWYTKLSTIEEAKNALDSGKWIYTWSMNWDWNKVKTVHIYWTKSKSYWHLFCIYSYIDSWFLAINNNGKDNGIFIIPYEYWDTLYTRYAISDKKDLWEFTFFNKYKDIVNKLDLNWYYKLYKDVSWKYGTFSKQTRILRFLWQTRFKIRVQENLNNIIF